MKTICISSKTCHAKPELMVFYPVSMTSDTLVTSTEKLEREQNTWETGLDKSTNNADNVLKKYLLKFKSTVLSVANYLQCITFFSPVP